MNGFFFNVIYFRVYCKKVDNYKSHNQTTILETDRVLFHMRLYSMTLIH